MERGKFGDLLHGYCCSLLARHVLFIAPIIEAARDAEDVVAMVMPERVN